MILSVILWASIIKMVAVTFWTAAIAWAIGEAFKKKPKLPSAKPSKFEIPQTEEGVTYGVIFGTPKLVANPVVAWWGNPVARAIMKHYTYNRWGNNVRKYYPAGHEYDLDLWFKVCHGPIDGIKQIRVGEKVAWPNPDDHMELAADGVTSLTIDQEKLFGGQDSEGGLKGDIDIAYGYSNQPVNSFLASKLGNNISAGRGLVNVILKGFYIGTSPYLRPWSFLCKRTQILDDGTPQWYISKADIDGDLNPAHILREIYTNTRWGKGVPVGLIDETSWQSAADTLYGEGFGLSYFWYDSDQDIEDLESEIKETINGKIYQDPQTGLIVFKLARDDYVVGNLEIFTSDSDIISIEGLTQGAYGKVPDMVQVNYTDVINNTTSAVPDQDLAVLDIQKGKSIVLERDFFGITKRLLAGKVAARERLQVTALAPPFTIKGKRTMSHLRPFDVIKITYSPHRTVQRVVRIIETDYGLLQNGTVTLNCFEDIFAMQEAIFSPPPGSIPVPIGNQPDVVTDSLLAELPFWSLMQDAGIDAALALDSDASFFGVSAEKPSPDSLDYELMLRDSPTGNFVADGRGDFTPTATLADAMPKNAVTVQVDLDNVMELASVAVGTYAAIGNELLKVTAVDTTNNRVTLARGVLDTVPEAHAIGDTIWFTESSFYMVGTEYTLGDGPGVKILPRTGAGQLDEADATAINAPTFNSRATRPYPPGDFKLNSQSYPTGFIGEPTISWAHRDRSQQTKSILEHNAASIGPEAGVTYTLKIYDASNTLRHTETGLTGTSYTYPEATEISECGSIQIRLRFVLYAVRSGYNSWQSYDITVPRIVTPAAATAVASKADPTVVIA